MENRDLAFDGLRGIAIIGVVACHISKLWIEVDPLGYDLWIGAAGAQLLFVAAGYGMFSLFGRITGLADFAVNRFSRIYPIYFVGISLSVLLTVIFSPPTYDVTPTQYVASLTMLQSWLDEPEIDGAFWSTGILLKFYLLMAGGIYLQFHRYPERFATGYLAIVSLLRLAFLLQMPVPHCTWAMLNTDHAHLFAAGMMLWMIQNHGYNWSRLAALAVCVLLQFTDPHLVWGSSAVAFFMLVSYFRAWIPGLKSRWLIHLGKLSLTIYMIHGVLCYAVIELVYVQVPSFGLATLVSLFGAWVVAEALYRGVELPWKRRLRTDFAVWWNRAYEGEPDHIVIRDKADRHQPVGQGLTSSLPTR